LPISMPVSVGLYVWINIFACVFVSLTLLAYVSGWMFAYLSDCFVDLYVRIYAFICVFVSFTSSAYVSGWVFAYLSICLCLFVCLNPYIYTCFCLSHFLCLCVWADICLSQCLIIFFCYFCIVYARGEFKKEFVTYLQFFHNDKSDNGWR
jgi:hypothetical protein